MCAALLMSKEKHVLDQDNQLLLFLRQGGLDWMILVELFQLRTLYDSQCKPQTVRLGHNHDLVLHVLGSQAATHKPTFEISKEAHSR